MRAPVGEDDTVALEHAVELAPVRPRRAEERQHPLVELRREPDLGSERYDGIPARPRCLGELHERLRHPGRDGHLRANGTLRGIATEYRQAWRCRSRSASRHLPTSSNEQRYRPSYEDRCDCRPCLPAGHSAPPSIWGTCARFFCLPCGTQQRGARDFDRLTLMLI